MKNVLMPLVLALLLTAAGVASWTLGNAQERLAGVETRIATLDFAPVVPADGEDSPDGLSAYARRVPGIGGALTTDGKGGRATAEYWLGRYDALALARDAGGTPVETDPVILLLAANAAYREARLTALDRDRALDRLDAVVKNYGDVLRSSAASAVLEDAAYNYEFTARMRGAIERTRNGSLPAANPNLAPPTVHGQAGGPPASVDMNQFKIVIPKRSDERDNNPEGGQGQERVRKG